MTEKLGVNEKEPDFGQKIPNGTGLYVGLLHLLVSWVFALYKCVFMFYVLLYVLLLRTATAY